VSNALEDLRGQLQAAMNTAQLNAFPIVPEKVTMPATFIGPADPYVSFEEASFGCVVVRHEIVIAVGRGVNEVNAGDVDLRVLRALAALPADFAMTNSVVGQVPVNGQNYLGAVLYTATEIEIPNLEELLP
jgi:hypothetical protein